MVRAARAKQREGHKQVRWGAGRHAEVGQGRDDVACAQCAREQAADESPEMRRAGEAAACLALGREDVSDLAFLHFTPVYSKQSSALHSQLSPPPHPHPPHLSTTPSRPYPRPCPHACHRWTGPRSARLPPQSLHPPRPQRLRPPRLPSAGPPPQLRSMPRPPRRRACCLRTCPRPRPPPSCQAQLL